MALAVSSIKRRQVQGLFVVSFEVTPSGNYATDGEALGTTLESLHPLGKSPDFVKVDGSAGFIFQYNHTTKKLLTFCNTAGGSDGALGQHTAAAYVANITGVAHKGWAMWLV